MTVGGSGTWYSHFYSFGICVASPTSIFSTTSTPADKVRLLSLDVLFTLGCVFLAIVALIVHVLVHYRARKGDTTEPPQVFGSAQIELAWTIIPTLIILVLFLGTARVVFEVQDAAAPKSALNVTVVGHQYWWEFRYPKYNLVTANELHIPLSDPGNPTPTYMELTSADVIHSFWVPSLAGKTDLLPNRVNEMWVDPHKVGLYEGQCAQFCGAQHAKMLLRVYVETPEDFQRWIGTQRQQAKTSVPGILSNVDLESDNSQKITPQLGRRVFEGQACISCHAVRGTVAGGRFGPDLTHLMSRSTIAAGIAPNTPENLLIWITDPSVMKPGSLMPAMHLTSLENKQITAYLTTLR
ncbi:MAG TPA: cytochrome c oxidase subunit II [Acidisarcina sp.]